MPTVYSVRYSLWLPNQFLPLPHFSLLHFLHLILSDTHERCCSCLLQLQYHYWSSVVLDLACVPKTFLSSLKLPLTPTPSSFTLWLYAISWTHGPKDLFSDRPLRYSQLLLPLDSCVLSLKKILSSHDSNKCNPYFIHPEGLTRHAWIFRWIYLLIRQRTSSVVFRNSILKHLWLSAIYFCYLDQHMSFSWIFVIVSTCTTFFSFK